MSVLRIRCPFCRWACDSTPREERTDGVLVIYRRLYAAFVAHLAQAHEVAS